MKTAVEKKKEKKIKGPGEGKARGLEDLELKRGGDYAGAELWWRQAIIFFP